MDYVSLMGGWSDGRWLFRQQASSTKDHQPAQLKGSETEMGSTSKMVRSGTFLLLLVLAKGEVAQNSAQSLECTPEGRPKVKQYNKIPTC